MRLSIAGGCGGEGRSCFFVSGAQHTYIVDCGTSTDGLDRVPDLTAEEIRSAEYIFLTHSHRDHTGALEYLEEMGAEATVLMSAQTYRQLHHKPKNATILDSTAPEVELLPDFTLRWGRSGHCCGAVWYAITCEGKTAFFSGDYREGDPFYRNDPVRDLSAEIAVIDAAYPTEETGDAMRARFIEAAKKLAETGAAMLLPAPHFGRGLPMAMLLWETFGAAHPVHLASTLYKEWAKFCHRPYFVNPAVLEMPTDAIAEWKGDTVEPGHIYILADAQLTRPASRALLAKYPDAALLLTGSAHGYGRAKDYLEKGRATQVLWPNHQTYGEMKALAAKNHFKTVIPFHDPNREPEALLYEF